MANIKISELPESQTFSSTDTIPIVTEGYTKRVSGSTLSDSIGSDVESTIVSDYINVINSYISTLNTRVNNLITTVNGYIKFGSIGICWGQINPSYANANVLQGTTQLPLSFTNGKCIATTVNYNNLTAELDAIAKVPQYVNGNSLTCALHSNAGKFTSGSTSFYINYIVIGSLSS